MYINQFWLGVVLTINVELIIIIINALFVSAKKSIEEKRNEKK